MAILATRQADPRRTPADGVGSPLGLTQLPARFRRILLFCQERAEADWLSPLLIVPKRVYILSNPVLLTKAYLNLPRRV